MNATKEMRQSKRVDTFWLVYQKDEKALLGYITDLSESGLRFWISREVKIKDDNFSIRVHPPQEIGIDSIDLDVHKTWIQKESNRPFYEGGGEFNNLTFQQKKNIDKLLSFFSKEKNTFFKNLDEAILNAKKS